MIRSFRVAVAIAAISLSSCGAPVDERQQAGKPKVQAFQSVALQTDLHYTDAEVVRDKDKGCEYAIFKSGHGLHVVQRMEDDGNGGQRQAGCKRQPASK